MPTSLTTKCKGQTLVDKQCSQVQYCCQHQSKITPLVEHTPTPVVAKLPVEVSSDKLGKMSAYVKPPQKKFIMEGIAVTYTFTGRRIDTKKPVMIFVDNEGDPLQSIEVNGMSIPTENYINIGLVTDKIGVRAWVLNEEDQTAYPFTFDIDSHDADGEHEVDGYYSQNDDYPDVDFAYVAWAKTDLTIGPK